ncbi:hypothetical protein BBF93_16320 [Hyphomonas sp. CACIAM 19H1]|uniref:autotransporter-associated beta strand repeat-containing protein n=1 Tax=Hyphomonas sp. CACIAM 19H1 TaxID=1873716 RepID=UPI000DED87B7|nr:autotransporter-associated beta strand repeat-containing protein [Hyphomonas sp. CACIAM 19H1]AXE65619.1 hypothetical protein BBF93_16320 [Hyphomonas sp. CACIAM 19H1]
MNRLPRAGRSGARIQTRSRYLARVSHAAMAACIIYGGSASAETAVFFNDDIAAGKQTFVDTIAAADANHNTNNPSTPQTSHVYEFDILNTSGSTFLVIGANGAPSVIVQTTRGGNAAPNNQMGNRGSDGFTNWSNSHNGTFAGAEALGYTFAFFESDGTTPFSMNALGTLVNDWGTCCTVNNPTPSGGTANASEVYLRFGASAPILLGGISSSISSTEHFIGAINDANFFDTVTVIASGNGEYFGVGGYLTFSTVALNSVPAGSSVVEGDGLENPSVTIPDIDTGSSYYTAAQLGASQVNPNFVGGTLRFNMDTFVNSGFSVQSQGGTIDTEGNIVSVTGGFSGAGTMQKTGEGLLVLSGANTNAGGFSVLDGILRASSDQNLGGGPLRIGNAVFQAGADMDSSRQMFVDHAGSRVDVRSHEVTWSGDISGEGALNLLGGGLLILSGENDYEGGTFVDQGTLAGAAGALQGNIANNGTVEFRQSQDGIYSGAMTGDGVLRKLGGGVLELTGLNTYSGGTAVMQGVLAGNSASLQGTIWNGATVEFRETEAGTYGGQMSGEGTLRKTGAGALLLTGANSYSGGTAVEEGTLIGAAGALQGDISNAGMVEFLQMQDGIFAGAITGGGAVRKTGAGVLLMTGQNSYTGATEVVEGTLMGAAGSIQGDVLNNASVVFTQAEEGTYSGSMSGEGALIKIGDGRLELAGANTFAGNISVLEGVLAAGHDTNMGAGSLTIGNAVFQAAGDIETNRELIIGHAASRMDVQSNDVVWNGVITGDGALNLLGQGRLVLTAENSYAGGTYIQQGVLAGAAGSIQGDVWNDGTIEFLQEEDGAYAGTIVGDGELRKLGNGLLRLTGQSGIAGSTFLDEGSLSVDGLLGTQLLMVANSASLFGNGAIDGSVMVLSGGMLKPGNSPGTLYISGDVTLSQGSVLEAEIDGRVWSAEGGAGTYDRIVLTGEGATFTAGGSINPLLRGITGDANNTFTPVIGDIFTIVVADNVSGTFDTLGQPQSGLAPNTRFKVLYNAETIQLALVARSLATLAEENALRSNAVTFGAAFDRASAFGEQASGQLLPLFTEFDGMSQAQVAGALASLSGDMHAHILESTESILRSSDEIVMTAAFGGRTVGGVDRELKDGTRVWARAEAGGASYDPDAAGFGFDEDVYGLTMGATFLNTPDMRAGIAGSYKTVELYNDTANGATNHMLSAYAYSSRTVSARLTLSGLLGYTQASPKVSRTTLLTSGAAFTKSDKQVSATHAQLEARYRLVNTGETSIYAIGGLRTAFMNVGAYRETGNIDHAELTLEAESRHTAQTNLGAEVARSLAGTDFALFANWSRDIGDDPTVERTAWLGDAVWQVQSTERDLNTYTYGFNARRDLSDRVGLELSYKGRYNSPNYDAQQLLLGVNIAW